jgi:hypothetical protein
LKAPEGWRTPKRFARQGVVEMSDRSWTAVALHRFYFRVVFVCFAVKTPASVEIISPNQRAKTPLPAPVKVVNSHYEDFDCG